MLFAHDQEWGRRRREEVWPGYGEQSQTPALLHPRSREGTPHPSMAMEEDGKDSQESKPTLINAPDKEATSSNPMVPYQGSGGKLIPQKKAPPRRSPFQGPITPQQPECGALEVAPGVTLGRGIPDPLPMGVTQDQLAALAREAAGQMSAMAGGIAHKLQEMQTILGAQLHHHKKFEFKICGNSFSTKRRNRI